MSWSTLPYLLPYILSLAISLGVGIYAWRRRDVAGASAYAWVALSQASWTLGYIFELASPSLAGKICWDNVQFIGGAGWFFAFLIFVVQYAGYKLRHPGRIWALLAIWPVLFLVLVFTDALHGWIRPEATLVPGEPFTALVYDFTPIVWAWAIYGYALFLGATALLIARFVRPHRLYRAQVGTIIAGTLIPLVGTLLTMAGVAFTFHRDTTPLTFALSNLVVAWGLFRYRLFDVVPMARDAVIEHMGDSVVVLDARDRVVDLNPAAQAVLGRSSAEVVGLPASQVYAAWSDLVEELRDLEEIQTEIALEVEGQRRHMDLRLSPLHDRAGRLSGRLIVVRDVTDQTQAREALRESEERYRRLVESTTDWVWAVDVKGCHTYSNQAVKQLLGYEVAELLGSSAFPLMHPQDRGPIREMVQNAVATRSGWRGVAIRWQHKDGSVRFFESTAQPILDAQGRLIGFSGIDRDVTDRNRAEEALKRTHDELEQRVQERTSELRVAYEQLRNREERYRTLFENANDAIFILHEGRFIEFNQAAEAMFGYADTEMRGKTPQELSPPLQPDGQSSQGKGQEKIAAALAGRPQFFEWVHCRADGACFDAEVSLNRLQLDEEWVLQAIVRDISERKRAEQALHDYAERLEVLHEIDRGILAAQSARDIAQVAVGRVRQLIPCRRVGLVLIDWDTSEAIVLAVDTDGETQVGPGTCLSFESVAAQVRATWQDLAPIRWENLEPTLPLHEVVKAEGTRAFVSVPLLAQDELIGFLNLAFADEASLTKGQEAFLRQVADQTAIAILNARLYDRIGQYTAELERMVDDRTRELQSMYEVMAIASQPLDLQTTLAHSLERVLAALRSQEGLISLLDEAESPALHLAVQQGLPEEVLARIASRPAGQGLEGWIVRHCEPLVVPDVTDDSRVLPLDPAMPARAYAGVPVQAGGRVLGVLAVLRETTQPPFSDEEVALLLSLAEQVGTVVESSRLRRLAEQAAVLEERQRLARDLHDSVTQSIYSLTLLAEAGLRMVQAEELQQIQRNQARLSEIAQQALQEMRLLVYELRPLPVMEEGLVRSIQHRLEAVERRAGVEARLMVEGEIDLPAPVEEELYRITQEALNNALKHARASAVVVSIRVQEGQLELEVTDDGQGFDPETVRDRGGLGLNTMRERVESLRGELAILSRPGEGTTVQVRVCI